MPPSEAYPCEIASLKDTASTPPLVLANLISNNFDKLKMASQDVVVYVNGKRYTVPNLDPTTKLITFLRNNSESISAFSHDQILRVPNTHATAVYVEPAQ